MDVRSKVKEFRDRQYQIRFDGDLSDAGKKKATDRLRQEMTAARGASLAELSAGWGNVKRTALSLRARRTQAQEREAAKWDYARLTFESTTAARTLANVIKSYNPLTGNTLEGAIRAVYEGAVRSGDKTRLRAWSELYPEVLAHLKGEGAGLAREMKRHFTELTTSPELARIAEEEQALVNTARELSEAGEVASAFYDAELGYPTGGGGFAVPTDWDKIRAGVRVSSKYIIPNSGEEGEPIFQTSLEVDDEPQS